MPLRRPWRPRITKTTDRNGIEVRRGNRARLVFPYVDDRVYTIIGLTDDTGLMPYMLRAEDGTVTYPYPDRISCGMIDLGIVRGMGQSFTLDCGCSSTTRWGMPMPTGCGWHRDGWPTPQPAPEPRRGPTGHMPLLVNLLVEQRKQELRAEVEAREAGVMRQIAFEFPATPPRAPGVLRRLLGALRRRSH